MELMEKVEEAEKEMKQATRELMEAMAKAGREKIEETGIISMSVFAQGVAEKAAELAIAVLVGGTGWTREAKLERDGYKAVVVGAREINDFSERTDYVFVGSDFSEVEDVTVAYVEGRPGIRMALMQAMTEGPLTGLELDRMIDDVNQSKVRKPLSVLDAKPRKAWQTCHGPAKRSGRPR